MLQNQLAEISHNLEIPERNCQNISQRKTFCLVGKINMVEMFVLYSVILSFNILITNCNLNCDCEEIDLLKDIFHKEMLEQKLESSRLRAKIRRIEATQRSMPTSAEEPEKGLADRMEKMETNFADIVKANDLINEKLEGNSNVVDHLRRGLMSEKQERVEFISEMEWQMIDLKESVESFNSDATVYMEQCKANITEAYTKVSTLSDMVRINKIDGQWTPWGTWSTCSVSCGSGIKERTRRCTNPSPSTFGRQCEGNSTMTGSCGNIRCPECSPGDRRVRCYSGTWNRGKSSTLCQRWDSQTPHRHGNGASRRFPEDDSVTAAHNYCRDPDNTGYLWCYTTDPNLRWEPCDVPLAM